VRETSAVFSVPVLRADAYARGEQEESVDLLLGEAMAVVETIAQFDDLAFAQGEVVEGVDDLLEQGAMGHRLGEGGDAMVFEGVGQMRELVGC